MLLSICTPYLILRKQRIYHPVERDRQTYILF